MVAAAFAACSRCAKRSRRTRMASSTAGSPGGGFKRRLIAGAHAVKTPAFDRRAGFDFHAHCVDRLELGRDRRRNVFGKCVFILCGTANGPLSESDRVSASTTAGSVRGRIGVIAGRANLAGGHAETPSAIPMHDVQHDSSRNGHKKPGALRCASSSNSTSPCGLLLASSSERTASSGPGIEMESADERREDRAQA